MDSRSQSQLADVLTHWYAVRALVTLEWLPAILVALTGGPRHYSELLEDANALHLSAGWGTRHGQLHESTLTRSLKRLTQDGLIERHERRDGFITTVSYSLTSAAEQLLDAIIPVSDWARQHERLIARARRSRGQVNDPKGHDAV